MSVIPTELSELPEIDSMADLMPGFEFDRVIFRDGTGAVYKACHRSLGRDVAIMVLPGELGKDPHFRSSFQANATAMARLTHPSLIRVYDYGDLDGQPVIRPAATKSKADVRSTLSRELAVASSGDAK